MGYRVVVKGGDERRYHEGRATTTITPGMLIQTVTANGDGSVQPATSAQMKNKKVDVAIEQMYLSGGAGDNYVLNDQVNYQSLLNGDQFMGVVAAGAAAIAYNDYVGLDPANPGCLLTTTYPTSGQQPPIGIARQAVNNSAGGSATNIRVEVI